MAIIRSSASIPPRSFVKSYPDSSAYIFDTQGNRYKVSLKGASIISSFDVPLFVYDTVNGEKARASADVIRQLAKKLIKGEAKLAVENDANGILRFTGISVAEAVASSPTESEQPGKEESQDGLDSQYDELMGELYPEERKGKAA